MPNPKINSHSTPLILLIGAILFSLRAWPRLIYPEIWVEDGTQTLVDLVKDGATSLLTPVSGYLVLAPKIISYVAFNVSFINYPLISIALTWVFSLFIFWVIAKAPTYLRGQLFLASACFLIPSDPEVFSLPSYSFWWSSLLLFILVFWKEQQNTLARATLLVLSSLSSPVCLITLPLFWLRGFFFKRYSEWFIAFLATALCIAQGLAMLQHNNPGQFNLINTLNFFIPTFFGSYLLGNFYAQMNWPAGIILFGFLLISVFKNRNWTILFLAYLLFASIFMSVYRVEISILNPINAGPRYFFYPFILTSWILVQLVFSNSLASRNMAALFLITSFINAMPHLHRKHDRLNWNEDVAKCANSQDYTFQSHFAGDKSNTWKFTLPGQECKKLIERDFLRNFPEYFSKN